MEMLVGVYILLAQLYLGSEALTAVYLSSTCTTDGSSITTSMRLQSSTALIYSNNMNCRFAVSAPSGYLVNANTRRFDLEHKRSGSCVDYVNFYDGGVTATSVNLLNSSPYCEATVPSSVISTGNVLTLEFITDSSAQYLGFDIIFAAVKAAPCSSSEFACSNGMCIDVSLECDGLNQCGDSSDEAQCSQAYLDSKIEKDNSALIAGLCIGLGSLVLIAVLIAIYVYREYRWKRFLRDPLPVIQQWDDGDNYPVTRKYYKQKYNNYTYQSTNERMPNDVTSDDDIDAMEPVKKSRPTSLSSSTSNVKDQKFTDTKWTSEA